MQKFKSVLLTGVILLTAGCSLSQAPDPQEVITEMITNMNTMTALNFDINTNIQQSDTETENSVNANVNIKGKTEKTDQSIPELELEISATLNTQDTEKGDLNGNAKFFITLKNSELFFKLDSILLPEELQKQTESFINLYEGNWYKFPKELLPDDLKNQIEEENTNQAEIQKLLQETVLFDVNLSSIEEPNYVYSTTINQEGFKTLVKEISRIKGKPMNETDLTDLDEFFTSFEHSIVLYIKQDSKLLDKLDFSLTSKNSEDDVHVNISITFAKHNQTQNIFEPEGAEDFNLMGLMGLGMLLEGSQGATSLNEDLEEPSMSEFENMTMENFNDTMGDLENPNIDEFNAMPKITIENTDDLPSIE